MEIWRDIKGFEGLYQISNYGKVKNVKTNRFLKTYKKSNNYLGVTLYKNNKVYYLSVHRLVAITFIPNPENKPCVGHKDCNRSNNKVENLYWCTYAENNNHPITRLARSNTLKGKRPLTKNQPKQIKQYSKQGVLIRIWESATEIGKNGFNRGNIQACCYGKRKSADGYIWCFN